MKRSRTQSLRVTCVGVALVASGVAPPAGLYAQERDRCAFLCAPELKIEPTFTIEHILSPARVETIEDSVVVETARQEREKVFELILVVDIPTEIPRVGFAIETIFVPFAETSENPFTGATAEELGRTAIRNNLVEVELELNLGLLEPEQTGGWVESHFDIVDKISPAARPDDTSAYTHKLNFELDTAVLLFKWLPDENWLQNIELEASLDYVATGLPKAGDVIGDERFLDDASPWSFSAVVVLPLAPLWP